MTDIFISYGRRDRDRVKVLASELTARGYNVWWDPHLKTGAAYRAEIGKQLEAAKAVIVVWSEDSVGSRFVCDEADVGAQRDTLFPVLIDMVDIPLGFRQIQTADLSRWRGSAKDKSFRQFIGAIVEFVGGPVAPPVVEGGKDAPASAQVIDEPVEKIRGRSIMTTGQKSRMTLIFRSLLLAGLIAGAFGGLAYVSDFVFEDYRPALIGGLAILVFVSRFLTFQADRVSGAASLRLMSRSYIALVLFALISIAPFLMEGRIYASALEAVRMQGIEGADINGVVFDASGERIATASDDGTVRLWNAKSGVELGAFRDHEDWVWGAGFSPDGQSVVSASKDMTAQVWSARAPKNLITLKGHTATVKDAIFDPKGRFIATASYDRTIRIWDPETGKQKRLLTGHGGRVTSLAISQNGNRLASSSNDGTVRIWDPNNGTQLAVLNSNLGILHDVALSGDGRRAATVSDSGTAIVWDVPNQTRLATLRTPGKLFAVGFVSDGHMLATGGVDGVLRLWNIQGQVLHRQLRGHQGAIRTLDVSPDDALIVSGSRDNTARIWEAETGREIQIMGHITPAVKFPIALDRPPLVKASRAPVPLDVNDDRTELIDLAEKGFGLAVILLVVGLLLKGGLKLVRLRGAARWAIVGVLGAGALYIALVMLTALPIQAAFLWLTLGFVPAAILAVARWSASRTMVAS